MQQLIDRFDRIERKLDRIGIRRGDDDAG
jgi:hypothetical protein